jgi:acetate kinase
MESAQRHILAINGGSSSVKFAFFNADDPTQKLFSGKVDAVSAIAQILPNPRKYFECGVKRYGFHGLSYEFLMNDLATRFGAERANGRVILAHLGSGRAWRRSRVAIRSTRR